MTGSAASVERVEDLDGVLSGLGLVPQRPTLVVVGGADLMSEDELDRLRPMFAELVLAADGLGAAVVDGGTDAGVMRLLGRERSRSGASFPLVGVVAGSLADRPGAEGDTAPLEPNHTHFVLVPGRDWGDETPWLARVAGLLAGPHSSLTLLVNGGDVSLTDVAESVRVGRRVLVVGGSGRAADDLASALAGATPGDRARELADSGLVRAVDLGEDSGSMLIREITETLSGGTVNNAEAGR